MERGCMNNKMLHVINFDITDNHNSAAIGAQEILKVAKLVFFYLP